MLHHIKQYFTILLTLAAASQGFEPESDGCLSVCLKVLRKVFIPLILDIMVFHWTRIPRRRSLYIVHL